MERETADSFILIKKKGDLPQNVQNLALHANSASLLLNESRWFYCSYEIQLLPNYLRPIPVKLLPSAIGKCKPNSCLTMCNQ